MSAAPAIVYCAWCKTVQLNLENVSGCVVIFPDEENRHAYVNGIPTSIADGICERCRATRFPEFPKKVVTHDLAQK
jgi:hypothetical protein